MSKKKLETEITLKKFRVKMISQMLLNEILQSWVRQDYEHEISALRAEISELETANQPAIIDTH